MGVKIYDADQLLLDFEEPIYERDRSSITEQAGYVDAETQVKRMMIAGATLADYRRGMYPGDFEYAEDEVPDDVKPDPTLDPMFDMADASAITNELSEKAKASKKEEVQRSETDDVADA